MKSLRMKRVLLTGAARGLGLAMARRFAAEGAEVVLTDVDEAALEEARADLESDVDFKESGARCRTYVLDVTDPEQIASVRERLAAEGGKIDVLVNNAGVVFGGRFLDVPLEKHLLTYRINVEGVVAVTQAFLPDLIDGHSGHVVVIASASGFVGLPYGSTYASSKWAAIGFAESLRVELKREGHRHVGVTTVCPSYIATGMFEGVKPPKATAMLSPESVAEKVVDAVKHRKVWVLEPWIVKITPVLKSALPTSLGDFVADAFGASSSMETWRGHGAEEKPQEDADARE